MPSSCRSLVSSSSLKPNIKPMNIFYVWYVELCRRSNTSPLAIVKPAKPKNDTVLDFAADRIKPEEWTPILNALRLDTSLHVIAIRSRVVGCKFLYEMNTEDRVRRMKRRCASLWTDYILRSLMRSLSCCAQNTQVLSSLELDGLPLSAEYLEPLLQTLRNNRTIKMLSFKHCPINDLGCQQLCIHLRFMPNIEVLNLSSCNLSSISGQHVARIIKHQQINRYCESWHNSLRYEDPTAGIMAGLKRITLNGNPNLGDEGLSYILDELDDDLWIKAIDMQRCNITENMSSRLIDVVEYSRSLEVADFRDNEHLSFATMEKILEILEKKRQFGNDTEYQWCVTTTTLYDFASFKSSRSNFTDSTATIHKSRSAPLRNMDSASRSITRPLLRRTKTMAIIDAKQQCNSNSQSAKTNKLDNAKKQLTELNTKLQVEISKRKETEIINKELQNKLENIRKLGSIHSPEQIQIQDKVAKVNHINEVLGLDDEQKAFTAIKESISKKSIKQKGAKQKVKCEKPAVVKQKGPVKRVFSPAKKQVQEKTSLVQNIFDKFFLGNDKHEDEIDEDIQAETVLNYYYDSEFEEDDTPKFPNVVLVNNNVDNDDNSLSGSDVSLERFLQEMNVVDEDLLSVEAPSRPNTPSSSQDTNNFSKFMVKVR